MIWFEFKLKDSLFRFYRVFCFPAQSELFKARRVFIMKITMLIIDRTKKSVTILKIDLKNLFTNLGTDNGIKKSYQSIDNGGGEYLWD